MTAEILNAQITPTYFPTYELFLDDPMHLQADKAAAHTRISDIRTKLTIEKGLDTITNRLDPHQIPIIRLEELISLLREVLGIPTTDARIEPTAGSFFEQAGGPTAITGVDFNLIAMHSASGHHLLFPIPLDVDTIWQRLAAEMLPRLKARRCTCFVAI
jgi:hypothetical protein